MIRVLFICHGNICRSPMAQYVLQDMVEKRGIADQFYIDSAATSTEEIGERRASRDQEKAPGGGHLLRRPPGRDSCAGKITTGMTTYWGWISGICGI